MNKIIDPFTNKEIDFIDPFITPESNNSTEDKGGMGAAFSAGVDKVQELGYRAVKGFTDSGNEGDGLLEQGGALANLAQEGIDRNIEEQKEYEPTVGSYKDIDSIGDAAAYTGELIAGSLPYMAGAMTGVGAAGMAGGLSQEAYEAQPEDEKNATRAVASGVGQMALERLGIKGSLGQIGKDMLKDGILATAKRYQKGEFVDAIKGPKTALEFSKRILKGSLWEGATEAGQESLAQWGAGKDLSEIHGLDEAFVGGFVVGGVIRTSTEGAQKVLSWQQKSAPIAKNGIDELVKQGVTQDEAIEQVRGQLITSAMAQGLTEAEAAAAAARTMKTEYDIDHEIFTPIANDVASRRAAMNERLNQQRIDGGIGDVQNALNGTTSPSADELVQQQMQANAPEFFEQLDTQEVNKVTQEEEFLPDPRTEAQWNADQDQEQADWEATFDADKTPEEHRQAFEAKQKTEQPQKAKIQGLEVTEAPVNELLLSNDVPQFKDGANDKGVVEPLGGKFERTGVAPIQVWVRKDGKKEVISGRHRLDLAKRSGEQTIPAQYHYEEDGFNQAQAASLDAILNVREGQGKVKDYVEFIKNAGLSEQEADAQGILGRATGKRAYTIANLGSDSLIAAHRNDGITDEGATRIAKAAPNDESLQAVGIKAINDGKSITIAENLVKAVGNMTQDQQSTGDLFGFDDSAMIEAEALATKASKKQAEIQRSLSAIKGAAKNPTLAAKEGVNVKNPKAVNQRIEQLKNEKQQWDNWHTNPKLVDELTGIEPEPIKQETPTQTASQEVVSISEPKESDVTDTNVTDTTQAPDLFAEKSIDEAAHEAATSPKNDLPEPTVAQAEANNYKLGRIEHSGMKIGIENPEGSYRKGIDNDGKEWSNKINHHYGDITGTKGADGDALDVFVNPGTESSDYAYIVNQKNKDGSFDEHKVMLGFDSSYDAVEAYYSNYDAEWKSLEHDFARVPIDKFKEWIKTGDTTQPYIKSGVEKVEKNNDKTSTNSTVDFSNLKSLDEKVSAWFELKSNDNIIDRKGNKRGHVFAPVNKRAYRTVTIVTEKGNHENISAVSILGKEGTLKALDEYSPSKPAVTNSKKRSETYHEQIRSAKTIKEVDTINDKISHDKSLTDSEHTKLDNSVVLTRKRLGFAPDWQKDKPVVESTSQPAAYGEGIERIKHTTAKGKELTGIIDNSLSRAEAKAIDPFTFRKGKLGWFIRENRIDEYNEKNSPAEVADSKVEELPKVTDTKDKAITENSNEQDTVDNQRVVVEQSPDLPSNEQGRSGTRDSSTGENDSVGNGRVDDSGRKPSRSAKRSDTNDTETSSLNLDDVPDIANGTESERVTANLDAIRLLKKIQSENRKATLAEKSILARYVGWGGLKSVIDPRTKKKFALEANKDLKALVTKEELNGIYSSVNSAFFTPKNVVKAMWSGVEAFGLGKSAMNVIEPSVGSGNFIGWQPEAMRNNSNWSATELDTITGNIAKLIYDDSNVQVTGFQDADFKQGVFSLAIGNPPYANLEVNDNKLKDISGMRIHNYMAAKSAKLLHENGLMMMVVTSRFLDTKNENHRDLSNTMDFVGAIRLPNTTFKLNAGTEVTTDIVVFRKLKKGEKAGNTSWTNTEGSINDVRVNKYFEENPQNILGELVMGQGHGGRAESTVNQTTEHSDIGGSITAALTNMAKGVDLTLDNTARENIAGEVMLAKSELGIGEMMIDAKGEIWQREGDIEGLGAQVIKVTPKSIWSDSGILYEQARVLGKDKEALAKFAKENLMSAKSGELKKSSPYNSDAFKALVQYVKGDLAFGTYRGKILKALDKPNGPRLGAKNYQRLSHMLKIRNTALELVRAEKQDRDNIEQLRKRLNIEYNEFARLGTKAKPETISANLKLLKGNVDLESGLDSVSKKGEITKGAIFTKRVIEPYVAPEKADTVDDAVNFAMQEKGYIDVGYVAELLGISKIDARKQLTEGEKPYLLFDPATEENVFIDDYLSGNVKRKLKEAEEAGLDANIKLLKAAQPVDKTPAQIKPSIRSPWVDGEVYEKFLEALGLSAKVGVVPTLGQIKITNEPRVSSTTLGDQFKNSYKISIAKLFDHAASGKALVIYNTLANKTRVKNEKATSQANVLVNKMVDTFATWANADPEVKQTMANNFNERINTHVNRSFNGRLYLKTIGQNPTLPLRKTQMDGALRMVQTDSVLLDHTVGSGKTFTAIAGVMQRKRLGLSRKPLIVVPNHIIEAFKSDFYKLYPGAKVLSASGKQMDKANRRQFFSQIATGEYDAVIIGHSHLKNLPNDDAATQQVYNEKLDELRSALEKAKDNAKAAGGRGASVSQIENSITTLSGKLKAKQEALAEKVDTIGFNFSDLGVDYMVVDEAHEFKNLMYSTSGDRVVGMNDPKGSEKAMDLLIKTRAIQGLDKGGLTFMTGTPISNSLVEIYTVMYYLGHKELKENGLSHYDAFAGSFVDTQVALEYTPTGTIKERRVLKGLNNIKELTTKYRQFADVVTQTDMVRIYKEDTVAQNKEKGENKPTRFPIPNIKGGQRQLKSAPASDRQKLYNDYLIARMEAISSITGRDARLAYAKLDNPLWVLSDAKKASLDVRLIDPRAERDPTGKVARAAIEIKELYDSTSDVKGTQLVFSDMGVPTKTAVKVAKADLIDLASFVMSKEKAKAFVTNSLKGNPDNAYSDTLSELVERVNLDPDLDPDTMDKADILIRDLESSTITADTGFSVYDDLRKTLIDSGIPAKQIAFIHDYNTPTQKSELFESFNEGDIRVVIGSTAKMGAGTNAQKRLVALHHMDAPWRPSDMEQREGRIIRQGNMFYEAAEKAGDPEAFEVVINAYSTEGSSDPVMWQILERKSGAIEQFRRGDIDEFVEEDNSDADSYANFKAQTTGNPIYKLKIQSDGDYLREQTEYTANAMALDSAKRIVDNYAASKKFLEKNASLSASIDNFDANAFNKVYLAQRETHQQKLSDFNDAYDAHKILSEAKKKKVKKPVKPVAKPFYELKNDYAKAIKANIVTPLSAAINVGLSSNESVKGKVKLSNDATLVVEAKRDAFHEEGYVDIFAYIETPNGEITLAYADNVKTLTGSARLMPSLTPQNITTVVEKSAKRAKSKLKTLEANYKEAKPKADSKLTDNSLAKAKAKNQWLEIEASIADIKENIRRSRTANQYIDSEVTRSVKRSSFNADSIKPEVITFKGEKYQTLGLKVESSHGFLLGGMPAHNSKGKYVHLIGVINHPEDGSRQFTIDVKEVVKKPGDVPVQDYSFLTDLQAPKVTAKAPTKAWQQEKTLDSALFRTDSPSTVTSDTKAKGIPLSTAEAIAKEFMDSYNGNVDISMTIKETQEEIYGPTATVKKYGRIKGAYNGKGNSVLGLVASNLHSSADARETLRHEILGHYGLDTFKKADKQEILDKIIASQNEPSLKAQWDKIKADKFYSTQNINQQAEEVFAHTIESGRNGAQKVYDQIIAWLRKAMRKVGLNKYPSSTSELRRLAETISKQIKSGERTKQTNNDETMLRTEGESINVPDETRKDAFIRRLQDKLRRLKVIQRELNVNESNDAYIAEEAFHGKVSEELRKLGKNYTDKIADLMAEHELSQDEVDLYLIAKHAQERNAYIDTINPELNGAGSGMSNEAAQAILDKALLENKRVALEAIANKTYAMLNHARNNMVQYGLETQDAINSWQDQYEYYVPLKGYAVDDGKIDANGKKFGSGKGFNIKGRETIKAMGRRSLAESPLLHAISDTTQSIIRARKNQVGNTFLKLVKDNPDTELWEVFTEERPDTKRGQKIVDGETVVAQVPMTAFEMKASDDYYKTKVDGKEHFIKIEDPLLLRAMGNLGVDEVNIVTASLGKFTRLLSSLVTAWNPEFMLTNVSRDIQAAIANMLAETQVADGKALNTDGLPGRMIKSIPKALSVLKHGFRDDNFTDAEWGPYLTEFLESGAKTGWVNQQDIEGLGKDLKNTISRSSNTTVGKARKTGKAIADFVHDYNDIVENAARFSAYYHARKQGVSVKSASSLAKNLTINFNRKGEIGNTLNAFYMFANASVQGTANMLRAVATPKDRSKSMWNPAFYNTSQKLAVAAVSTTVVMANIMRVVGGDDDDGVPLYDKIPDFIKATNFVMLTGGKDKDGNVNYISIPMPYGYNIFANMGHAIDGATQGKSVAGQAANLLLSAASAFSPIGMQESESAVKGLVKTVSPTILKPMAELAVNENFFGSNIFPEERGYSANKADAHLGNAYTWEWTKNLTTWLNDNTGGTTFKSGAIDISPQSIEHLIKFVGGGVLQFTARWQNLAVKASNGEEVKPGDVPFSRRFFKQLNPKAAIGEFYDDKELLNDYLADLKSLHGQEKAAYYKANKSQLQLAKYGNGIEKALRLLNAKKRSIESSKLSKEDKVEKIRLVDDRKIELTLRFSKKKQELGLKYL